MTTNDNTLLLRLAGPLQSWGTSSRFQIRRTDLYPSKSGVLGMLLCAMGITRKDSTAALEPLNRLLMGVRVDQSGTVGWDYHTAGAKIGIRQAEDGRPKKTQSTGEYETLVSRRQYLYDASFFVVLMGDKDTIADCRKALDDPAWPIFLGRKSCVPSEPVFIGTGHFDSLTAALESHHWQSRHGFIDDIDRSMVRTLDIYLEHQQGSPPPEVAKMIHDVPKVFGFYSHDPRWIVKGQVTVTVGKAIRRARSNARHADPYSEHFNRIARPSRLRLDNYLCVFCKSPAKEVHHVSYENAGHETDSDLRSLCKLCHAACTMLEYGSDMRLHRVDPSDPDQRLIILHQIERLLNERRHGRKYELMSATRKEL